MSKLTDKSLCPVNGKHNGDRMEDVPADYLDWLREQSWLKHKYPDVSEYIEENWSFIEAELKEMDNIRQDYRYFNVGNIS